MTEVLPLELQRERDPRRTVLFVTDNGHGLGHLTRMMAVARRLPRDVRPRLLTCSRAHPLAAQAGFDVEYLASPTEMGLSRRRWELVAEQRVSEVVEQRGVDEIVLDHVHPWGFFARLRDLHGGVRLTWFRRGLWRPGRDDGALELARHFDRVIEPSDLAAVLDHGPTARAAGAIRIPPVTVLDREELLSQEEARAALSLPADGECVLVQLSADDGDTLARLVARARDGLRRSNPDATVVVPRHPLHPEAVDMIEGVATTTAYPMVRQFAAFDCAVSTVGYNTFHELVLAAVPTLFVARDTAKRDNQLLRARSAALAGCALHLEDLESPAPLQAALAELADHRQRRRMRAAAAQLLPTNGAHQAAALLAG